MCLRNWFKFTLNSFLLSFFYNEVTLYHKTEKVYIVQRNPRNDVVHYHHGTYLYKLKLISRSIFPVHVSRTP